MPGLIILLNIRNDIIAPFESYATTISFVAVSFLQI